MIVAHGPLRTPDRVKNQIVAHNHHQQGLPRKGKGAAVLTIPGVGPVINLAISLQGEGSLQRAVRRLPLGNFAVQQTGEAGHRGHVRLLVHRRDQGIQGGLIGLLYYLVGQGFQRRVYLDADPGKCSSL